MYLGVPSSAYKPEANRRRQYEGFSRNAKIRQDLAKTLPSFENILPIFAKTLASTGVSGVKRIFWHLR